MKSKGTENKLTKLEFVLLAMRTLDALPEKPGFKSKGRVIHTVYSGFNKAFRDYFDGDNPVDTIKELFEQGHVSYRLAKGGAVIALPGVLVNNENALSKMKLDK